MNKIEISRRVLPYVLDTLNKSDSVIIIYGPRQVGKTTLLSTISSHLLKNGNKVLDLQGDTLQIQKIFSSQDPIAIRNYIGEDAYILIDEAQRIENIGINLKIIKDQMPDIKVIATGSSSFELANKVNEPLTGRKKVFMLYPISALELRDFYSNKYLTDYLENFMRFGMYPKVLTFSTEKEKISYLQEVVQATLYKDILELENIKNPDILGKLLVLLAFQIGNEVSLGELANSLRIAKETVARYLDLLEKAFIIKNIQGFSRNLRNEITKTSRYYFTDIGVRNTIIGNYNPLDLRDDVGMLWENFLVMERLKKQEYILQPKGIYTNNYFWRTYEQKEVDWVEEHGGKIFGFEFKWNPKKAKRTEKGPKEFVETYNADFEAISPRNFVDFVSQI